MDKRSIILEGQSVDYHVRVSTRARRPGLLFGDGGLEVVLPRHFAHYNPESVLSRFQGWVLRQIERRRDLHEERRGWPTHRLLVRGVAKDVRLIEEPLFDGFSFVTERPGNVTVNAPHGEKAAAILTEWLMAEAEKDLRARLAVRCEQMNETFTRLRIADQRSLWGSCAPARGTLSFNFRLVLAPPSALDYLVVHELAHFSFRRHGPRFWARVERFRPDYVLQRAWLREHGWKLRLPTEYLR
ncbi:MAG: M48 family metallopeptidase [Elusimicrobia bacterium]|nr:M48 family metallopeptidase [Elusimicrobiota bacterium]